jgi:hypothetical protein
MADVITYHGDPARLGTETGAAGPGFWSKRYEVDLPAHPPGEAGAAVRGAPLFLQGWQFATGPQAGRTHDVVIVVSSDNRAYAYADEAAGAPTLLWTQFLGAPLDKTGSNIPPPVGTASTPVADLDGGRLFVVTLRDNGAGAGQFWISALDLDTGSVIQDAPLSDPGGAGRPTFDSTTLDQRGGLNLVDGFVMATFADFLAYDEGPYHGWVVAAAADNLNRQAFLPLTRTVTGGGAWGPGGAAAAADGTFFVATGNAPSANDAYWASLPAGTHPGDRGDYFEGVVRIAQVGSHHAPALSIIDWYQPTNAKAMNDADQDFGSSSPLVLPPIGGRDLIVVSAKDGDVYLLDAGNLGHWGNELWRAHVFGAEAKCAPAYYRSGAGHHFVYVVGSDLPGLVAYRVAGTSLVEAWRADGGTLSLGDAPGSAVVAASPGSSAEALVWIADAGDGTSPVLLAYDALTGARVYSSAVRAGDTTGPLPHFPAITCAGPKVYLATAKGYACYSHRLLKIVKELKPEVKFEGKAELKENLKLEHEKLQVEGPKFKDAEVFGGEGQGGDPVWQALMTIAGRLDDLENRLAAGQPFIRPEERPQPPAPLANDTAADAPEPPDADAREALP